MSDLLGAVLPIKPALNLLGQAGVRRQFGLLLAVGGILSPQLCTAGQVLPIMDPIDSSQGTVVPDPACASVSQVKADLSRQGRCRVAQFAGDRCEKIGRAE